MVFMKRKTINLGEQSVSELTILEWKRFFSIKLFNFHPTEGKQDRFHTHAFNAVSVLLSGNYVEEVVDNDYNIVALERNRKRFLYIPADGYHRITRSSGCRTLLITGPWGDEFRELRQESFTSPDGYSVWTEWFCGKHRVDLRRGKTKVLRGETK